MTFMTWTDAMSVGITEIDAQHQILVGLINELADAVAKNVVHDELEDILERALSYTATHFKFEEDLLARTSYPDLDAHKAEHASLAKTAMELSERFLSGADATISVDTLVFFKRWLTTHIMGTDRKYSAHLQANGLQ